MRSIDLRKNGCPDERVWALRKCAERPSHPGEVPGRPADRATGAFGCCQVLSDQVLSGPRVLPRRPQLDRGIGTREEQALMAVIPADQVRRATGDAADFDDHPMALRAPDRPAVDDEAVPDGCVHDVSPFGHWCATPPTEATRIAARPPRLSGGLLRRGRPGVRAPAPPRWSGSSGVTRFAATGSLEGEERREGPFHQFCAGGRDVGWCRGGRGGLGRELTM
ncbi:hypothetical protein FRAHR75_340045 [Frankia sp. Hr75.2]|nr:hypothetical protein FRAHR75_340045 [Frankia sp. Hr75.2]